jgi:hypothetical protein
LMILFIINNSNSDFDPYFLNCFFFKSFWMIDFFLILLPNI